jgi:hypothetical protein
LAITAPSPTGNTATVPKSLTPLLEVQSGCVEKELSLPTSYPTRLRRSHLIRPFAQELATTLTSEVFSEDLPKGAGRPKDSGGIRTFRRHAFYTPRVTRESRRRTGKAFPL